MNETNSTSSSDTPAQRKVLVIDDSLMLLNFVKEILAEANYAVAAAPTAEEGLRAAASEKPHLILLDYVLPDMSGEEILGRLREEPASARVPVVYMSGFGADLKSDPKQHANVIGSLNKPFTSELLLKTIENYMPKEIAAEEPAPSEPVETVEESAEEIVAPDEPSDEEILMEEAPVEAFDEKLPEVDEAEEFAPEAASPEAISTEAAVEEQEQEREEEQEEEAVLPETIETEKIEASVGGGDDAWWSAVQRPAPWSEETSKESTEDFTEESRPFAPAAGPITAMDEGRAGSAYFCGDTSFFSLNWALHAIGKQKLTGTLRSFWDKEPVELLAREGKIVLVTTRDPQLYCAEAPITLVNLDEDRVTQARQQQRETSRPLFITLTQEGLILREPALQLVQHYGQKLFAQLWSAPRVRFIFEQSDTLPSFADNVPEEEDIDHWTLSTLRFIQHQELGNQANYDQTSIPAYTRDGFERVQHLRLTVAEAQFASQFNGARSIAQIAKNLRLDLKFARLTLFRFLALEIVECWPPALGAKQQEKRGVFGRIFGE